MNIEKKRIEGWSGGNGVIGHITLDKLAIPETVKVTLYKSQYQNYQKREYNFYQFRE